ncbi:MAG: alpha/beta hydrolase, partial [Bacteroidota bacterium]
MESEITSTGKFKFIEGGEGEPLILLHGLLGALSNFEDVFEYFKTRYNVIVLKLPLYELSQEPSVSGLARYVHKFIESRQFEKVHLLGNSSGGHVSLVYTLNHPERVKTLTLTGSSGLF